MALPMLCVTKIEMRILIQIKAPNLISKGESQWHFQEAPHCCEWFEQVYSSAITRKCKALIIFFKKMSTYHGPMKNFIRKTKCLFSHHYCSPEAKPPKLNPRVLCGGILKTYSYRLNGWNEEKHISLATLATDTHDHWKIATNTK